MACKSRAAKPKSKGANPLKQQLAARRDAEPAWPRYARVDRVLFLQFDSPRALTAGIGRAHVFYEGEALRGPLAGCNMPIERLRAWSASTASPAVALSKIEMAVLQIAGIMPAAEADADVEADAPGNGTGTAEAEADTAANMTTAATGDAMGDAADGLLRESPVDYVVAAIGQDRSSFLHEYAHAVYYLNPSYAEAASDAYAALPSDLRAAVEKELAFRNYAPAMFADEWQAYLQEGLADYGKKWVALLQPFQQRLRPYVKLPALTWQTIRPS
ncbi:hypothetical protein CXG81DRAFT_8747 [Caulochytrium protostelioides]|uniref:Uncharacterized protein n=1 Tax=Caulochytrium protostelioides TaxID=1555241 RepID=A0A4P9XEU4_9FUNG|nr:hypothetical protein CXG81DRAFT_8747 [Caulochytrium protostelioides]|eukprot:RKP04042.1 hypothetical protein CXG81DRAFT_8747 [Caulochytrium protostelioides]